MNADKNHSDTMESAIQQVPEQQAEQGRVVVGEAAMESAGADFAAHLIQTGELQHTFLTLSGDLGAGKTTFCRGFLRHCGYRGPVKSPTYTLLEEYDTVAGSICHLDLYRLNDPDELEYIGFRDLLESEVTLLIEWPERVPELVASATASIRITHRDADSRRIEIIQGHAR